MLTATGLTLIRGERCLFTGVEFALEPGELLLLEGDNGSGKTSLLKGLLGILEFEHGDLRWCDEPVRDVSQDYFASLAWMPHRPGFKGDLTLVENLDYERCLRPAAAVDFEACLARLSIGKLKKLPFRSLSAGQQRRVALARMLMASARLWLMDEPFTNLDRAGRRLVESVVEDHLGAGGSCIMAAHQDVDIDATTHRVNLS